MLTLDKLAVAALYEENSSHYLSGMKKIIKRFFFNKNKGKDSKKQQSDPSKLSTGLIPEEELVPQAPKYRWSIWSHYFPLYQSLAVAPPDQK